MRGDLDHPERADDDEIEQHDRAEQLADRVSAAALDQEQADQDDDRGGDDPGGEGSVDGFQPLDRRQHRHRRRDHRVAQE